MERYTGKRTRSQSQSQSQSQKLEPPPPGLLNMKQLFLNQLAETNDYSDFKRLFGDKPRSTTSAGGGATTLRSHVKSYVDETKTRSEDVEFQGAVDVEFDVQVRQSKFSFENNNNAGGGSGGGGGNNSNNNNNNGGTDSGTGGAASTGAKKYCTLCINLDDNPDVMDAFTQLDEAIMNGCSQELLKKCRKGKNSILPFISEKDDDKTGRTVHRVSMKVPFDPVTEEFTLMVMDAEHVPIKNLTKIPRGSRLMILFNAEFYQTSTATGITLYAKQICVLHMESDFQQRRFIPRFIQGTLPPPPQSVKDSTESGDEMAADAAAAADAASAPVSVSVQTNPSNEGDYESDYEGCDDYGNLSKKQKS